MKTLFSRSTVKGIFAVAFRAGEVVATLDGHFLCNEIKALKGNETFVAAISGVGITAEQLGMIDAAKADWAASLEGQRERLAAALCGTDAFPGSATWRRATLAEAALAAFDLEHPEIFAAILAAKRARLADRYID